MSEVSGGNMVTGSAPQRRSRPNYEAIENGARALQQFVENGKLFDGLGRDNGKSIGDKIQEAYFGNNKKGQKGVIGNGENSGATVSHVVEGYAAPVKPAVESKK